MATSGEPKTVHQLKITIANIRPPVWRRVLVPSSASLGRLHIVIQELFGWWNCHLHEFQIDGTRFGIDDGEGWGEPALDEDRAKLIQVAPKGAKFLYLYDFGDDWEHRVVVEDVLAAEPKTTYPRCVAGRRAGPPEDVGGPWGYERYLEVIADPEHEEHESMIEWAGEGFDANAFDLAQINDRLTPMRR